MFAIIYRGYINEGKELEFQKLWHKISAYFVKERGALGSSLHKTEEGYWLAYSRWPDKATRDASWPGGNDAPSEELPNEIRQAINNIKPCINQERKFADICMELFDHTGQLC